ncbi:MAG: hypothetical protein ACJAZO_003614 [Myxococcota bacterium]|jgi:hypothetical protein
MDIDNNCLGRVKIGTSMWGLLVGTDNLFAPPDVFDHPEHRPSGNRTARRLSSFNVIRNMWKVLVAHPATVLTTLLTLTVVQMLLTLPDRGFEYLLGAYTLPLSPLFIGTIRLALPLATALLSLFFTLGAMRIFVALTNGDQATFSMIIGEARSGPSAIIVYGLSTVFALVGLVFLLVPGLLIYLGLQFALFVVVHERLGPMAAMRRSWQLTEGRKANLFLVQFVFFAFFVGLIYMTGGIGVFVVWPIMTLAQAVIFCSLLHYDNLWNSE